jgi:hypothetical protein
MTVEIAFNFVVLYSCTNKLKKPTETHWIINAISIVDVITYMEIVLDDAQTFLVKSCCCINKKKTCAMQGSKCTVLLRICKEFPVQKRWNVRQTLRCYSHTFFLKESWSKTEKCNAFHPSRDKNHTKEIDFKFWVWAYFFIIVCRL